MFKSICTLTMIVVLAVVAAPTASAHDRAYDYYQPRNHHAGVHRDRYMPRWLRDDRGFQHWYRRSSLHHDHHLAWWRLYEIYRWERVYRHDHHRHHGYDRGHAKRKRHYRHDD
jgi:hypothetical protein